MSDMKDPKEAMYRYIDSLPAGNPRLVSTIAFIVGLVSLVIAFFATTSAPFAIIGFLGIMIGLGISNSNLGKKKKLPERPDPETERILMEDFPQARPHFDDRIRLGKQAIFFSDAGYVFYRDIADIRCESQAAQSKGGALYQVLSITVGQGENKTRRILESLPEAVAEKNREETDSVILEIQDRMNG